MIVDEEEIEARNREAVETQSPCPFCGSFNILFRAEEDINYCGHCGKVLE